MRDPRVPESSVRSLLRYASFALIGCIVVALGLSLYVYAWTEHMLDRRYPVVGAAIPPPAGPGAVERGKDLADRTGCTDCHKADLRGSLFADDGWLHGRYYASNLTRKAQIYSDEDFARIVRLGVRPDGRGVFAMPSFAFNHLTDGEMADLSRSCDRCPRAAQINRDTTSARSIDGIYG